MKFLKSFVLIQILTCTLIQAETVPMKKYENESVDISEIASASSYTLVFSCTQKNPIVVYAPDNFSESQERQIHRYLLPNTTLSETIDHDFATVQQDGHHVQVLLFGQLLLQTVGDYKANFMVSVK